MSSTTETGSISIDGASIRFHVRPAVGGSGTPLVIANGLGASLEMLQPFVDHLPPQVEVVRFDVPGVGGSAAWVRLYRFATLARMLRRMLQALGYARVDMLGISWGGGLAQQFAFTERQYCRRLVLVSTSMGALAIPGSPRVLKLMATPRRYLDRAYAREIAATLYGGSMREHPERAARLLSQPENRVGPGFGYWQQLFAVVGWTSLPWLPLLRQPTLILAGDDDPLVPVVNARIMARLIPHASLHVFHDGHLGLLTKADSLAPLIAGFLSEYNSEVAT